VSGRVEQLLDRGSCSASSSSVDWSCEQYKGVEMWIVMIVLAAVLGGVAYELTGSSEIAYIVRAITRGLG
jgi:hypothetical protein